MSLEPGQVIDGKYRIVRQLGVGGMGAVYEGENVRIHRKVAIKVLHAQVATKADIVQRFEREAQAAGRIGSKHIVEVLDLGNLPGGERYMVMEYLDGESLGERLKRVARLTPAELVPVVVQVLDGLGAAHEAGIVHRDLKPDNVYLLKPRSASRPEEFVKLLDFGVSKFSSLDSDMSMTSTGAVMGTPYYLSPEQARGGKVDARSDLYAIGVVLYQCLAGHVPFQADSFNELLFKIALESPKPLGAIVPGIDPRLVALVDRGMARDPGARFQSAAEMRDALVAWAQSGAGGAAVVRAPATTTGLNPAFSASAAGAPGLAASLAVSAAGAHQGQLAVSGFGPPAMGMHVAAGAGSALGQSGGNALGQSGGNALGQSGGNALGQSGGNALGQSGGAMAVTAPQQARRPVVALLAATLVMGCGLGFGVWYAFGGKATGADVAVAAGPDEANAPEVAARPTADPAASAEPAVGSPDASGAPDASAAPDAAPDASAAADTSAAALSSAAPDAPAPASAEPAPRPPRPRPAGGAKPPAGGTKATGGSKPPSGGAKPPSTGAGGRVITPTL